MGAPILHKDNKGPEGLSSDGLILNEGYPTAIANTGRMLTIGKMSLESQKMVRNIGS